jgi:hypothetical protein
MSKGLEDMLQVEILPVLANLVDPARAPFRLLDALGYPGGGGGHAGFVGYAVPTPRERSRNRQHQSMPAPLQTEHIPQMPVVLNRLRMPAAL